MRKTLFISLVLLAATIFAQKDIEKHIRITNPYGFESKQSEYIDISEAVNYSEITDEELEELYSKETGGEQYKTIDKLIAKRVNVNISLPITYRISQEEWNKLTKSETDQDFIKAINETIFEKLKIIQNS